MGSAQEKVENHATEIEGFLIQLFAGQNGYVYVPTKDVASEYWQPYFFKWPDHKTAIVTHLLSQSREKDVYVGPSIFKAPSDKKQAWQGSNYVWAEFDGNAPDSTPNGIPAPSIRIQSSTAGHEHWYWQLEEFERDYHKLEGLAKQLTYTLDADKSGWDCSQVLRPPGTLHQESKRRVRLLDSRPNPVGYADFKNLVTAPEPAVLGSNFDDLPDVQDVIGKFKWDKDALDLFHKKEQPIGSRSSAMTRLGFHCVEMGMSNEECYVVLYNADERWGKYRNRSPADRAKRLIGIISHCRGRKKLDAELNLSERPPLISVGDLLESPDYDFKWLFKDFLAEQGLGVVSAAPGVGKSTLSIQLGISVILARDFLIWKSQMAGLKRVAFFSLEMGHTECRNILKTVLPGYGPEEQEVIKHNYFFYPQSFGMPLSNKADQQFILDQIDLKEIDFVIFDSLKAATMLDEHKTDSFFNWLNKDIRTDRKCAAWIIHHNRKPPNEGPRKPRGLEDMYGSTYIGAHPSAIISLWRLSKNSLEVNPLKLRLAEEAEPFKIKRGKHLSFKVDGTANGEQSKF